MSKWYSIDQVLEVYENLEEKKWLEKMIELLIKNVFWWENIEKNQIFKKAVRDISTAYPMMKEKFEEVLRTDGERYFEHLRAVANIILENISNPSIDKVLIALLHDAIEDTKIDFHTLYIIFWPKIAIAVQALSKKPWEDYRINTEVTRKACKIKSNEEYFGHLKSYESMREHVLSIAEENTITLNSLEIDEITMNIFDVKFADRIHNLSTQWDPNNIEKVKRKIEETQFYFLDIAKELNIDVYNQLKSLILQLEIKIAKVSNDVTTIINEE